MFLEDLVVLIVAAGVSSADIFSSSAAQLPTVKEHPTPIVTLTQTGGMSPERTHNTIQPPAYEQPSAQIVVRAVTYLEARALAYVIYAGVNKRNSTINSTWYRELEPKQEPFDLGLDENKRTRSAFNVSGIKRP